MSVSIHVISLFNVGEVEGIEETRRDGTDTGNEHATLVSSLRLHNMDSARVEEQLAGAMSKVSKGPKG